MTACVDREIGVSAARVSLVLPLMQGGTISPGSLAKYRQHLEADAQVDSVEVIVSRHAGGGSPAGPRAADDLIDGDFVDGAIHVTAEGRDWSSIVRAGLRAATGDHFV